MGGYEAGEVASRMALEGLQEKLHARRDLFSNGTSNQSSESLRHQVRDYLDQAVQELSYEIFSLAQRQGGDFRMGTTLCALISLGDVATVVHVGDSRCYLWRGQQLYQATEDHSLVNEQLKSGIITPEEAARSRYKNVITRAVGMADRLQVDLFFVDLQAQDRFILCSDGLHGYLQGDELGNYLVQEDLNVAGDQLIELANRRGGKDNITLVMVAVEGRASKSEATAIDQGIDVLKNNPLFDRMTYPEMLKILPLTTHNVFPPGSVLMREGDPGGAMYIIQDGKLDVYREGELIATLAAGDYVGEMSVFDDEKISATVVASGEAKCLAVSGPELLSMLRQEPDIGFKIQQGLIRVLCKRLRNTSHALAWTRQEWRRSVPS